MSETIKGDQVLQRCQVCGRECFLDNRAAPAKWACACGWQSGAVPGKAMGAESVPVLLEMLRGKQAGGCGKTGHVTAAGSEGTCWCETCRANNLLDQRQHLLARLAAAEAQRDCLLALLREARDEVADLHNQYPTSWSGDLLARIDAEIIGGDK